MNEYQFSSGDLTADRRFAYAQGCAEEGDFAAAADLLRQALEMAPLWPAGWFRLGEYLEKLDDIAGAIDAYGHCCDLSAKDRFGARLKLALLRGEKANTPPLAYTEALFDEYAEKFDHALVEKLGYRVPQMLAACLEQHVPDIKFENAIDLGCGTGLMAGQVRSRCRNLIGVDLSEKMLDQARAKNLYDSLEKADLLEALAKRTNITLVMAADVFMYLPSLADVMCATTNALQGSGYFLFSVEKSKDGEDWELLPSRRHAHSENYIRKLLKENKFEILSLNEAPIRMDAGEALIGLICLARLKGNSR